MHPRFGTVTKVLACFFIVAGLGALEASLATGSNLVGGRWDGPILLGIAVVLLPIGAGIWLEARWAWATGAAVTALVSVLGPVLRTPDKGWYVWWIAWAGFAVSLVDPRRRGGERSPGGP